MTDLEDWALDHGALRAGICVAGVAFGAALGALVLFALLCALGAWWTTLR